MMVHPICLMPIVQMNQLLAWAPPCLSVHDVPPSVPAIVALPSPVDATLVISRVSPSSHATPSLLLPFSSYSPTFA